MANLTPRLHSMHVETDGAELQLTPGTVGIRCHVPISVFTDDHEIAIEANVDSEFETASGAIRVYRRHSPVAVELWTVPPKPVAAATPSETASEAASPSEAPAAEASTDK